MKSFGYETLLYSGIPVFLSASCKMNQSTYNIVILTCNIIKLHDNIISSHVDMYVFMLLADKNKALVNIK